MKNNTLLLLLIGVRYRIRPMFGSNYNTNIVCLANESMGQLKLRTDSKVAQKTLQLQTADQSTALHERST